MNFSDRFIINGAGFNPSDLETMTEEQIKTAYPDFYQVWGMVRAYSVLIKKKTATEVYQVVTQQADPRIALVLAAARDNYGDQLFPTMGIVKEFMFAKTSEDISSSGVTFQERTIFFDGIKRVCCALTASILIGQLAQIPEQAAHANQLEKQALEDLDRILKVPAISDVIKQIDSSSEASKPSFFFEPKKISIGSRTLSMDVFLSSDTVSAWTNVGVYTDVLDTAVLASELGDFINSSTLSSTTSNLLAATVLAGLENLHAVEFQSRLRSIEATAELVSVKFLFTDAAGKLEPLPFKWGVQPQFLKNYAVNSVLTTVSEAKAVSAATTAQQQEQTLSVIYFKRRLTYEDGQLIPEVTTEQPLTFRISPTMDTPVTILVPVNSNPADRPNQVATLLLNELFTLKLSSKTLGCLIQNDPVNSPVYYSALQIVAWTLTENEVELILDIIEMPEDIEIALGNTLEPLTKFSSKPRSLKTKATLASGQAVVVSPEEELISDQIKLITHRQSPLLQRLRDIRNEEYINYLNRPYL